MCDKQTKMSHNDPSQLNPPQPRAFLYQRAQRGASGTTYQKTTHNDPE